MTLVKQELPTLSRHLISLQLTVQYFVGQCFSFWFFFCHCTYCLSFDLRLLNTPLLSSNFSYSFVQVVSPQHLAHLNHRPICYFFHFLSGSLSCIRIFRFRRFFSIQSFNSKLCRKFLVLQTNFPCNWRPTITYNKLLSFVLVGCMHSLMKNKLKTHHCFVCLRLVYPMLPISLDFQFLIAPSVFSNVYVFQISRNYTFLFIFLVLIKMQQIKPDYLKKIVLINLALPFLSHRLNTDSPSVARGVRYFSTQES